MKNSEQPSQSQSRKTKKISLEVYEDAEAAFYLALLKAKNASTLTPEVIQSLLGAIHYPEDWFSSKIEGVV